MVKFNRNFDVFPKVVTVGQPTGITIMVLKGAPGFVPGASVTVMNLSRGDEAIVPVKTDGEKLTFSHAFPREGEYYVRIAAGGQVITEIAMFAVDCDLAGKFPFLGDLHMHSNRSDGREDPAVVAANYCLFGYDFTTITDHNRYYPSLEAIAFYRDVLHEFMIYPGEEVHLPGNPVHIINFGGDYSINGLVETSPQIRERGQNPEHRSMTGICPDVLSEDEYREQVTALAKRFEVPAPIDAFSYAACVWIFDHIRAANGLGIFCHPFWISKAFNVSEEYTEFMMATQPFDAFEVLGGENYYEQNGFQTAKYYDDRTKGRRYPIVGSTDSHGSTAANPNAYVARTIVFAEENTRDAIVKAIRNGDSVAVDAISAELRVVGEYRLVKYAWFLLKNYFPIHREVNEEQGRLLKRYAEGDQSAKPELARINGRMRQLRAKYFAFATAPSMPNRKNP